MTDTLFVFELTSSNLPWVVGAVSVVLYVFLGFMFCYVSNRWGASLNWEGWWFFLLCWPVLFVMITVIGFYCISRTVHELVKNKKDWS